MSESSTDARLVEQAVEAIEAGEPVVLPTDTVYGLCTKPDASATLTRLKGRDEHQPIALLAAGVDTLFDKIPELRDQATLIRALLPGRLTLILPNPAHRYDWLTGERHDAIGVRVPELEGAAREIVERVGRGGGDEREPPRRARSAPAGRRPRRDPGSRGARRRRRAAGNAVDRRRPHGRRAKILREGAVPAADVLERLASARG